MKKWMKLGLVVMSVVVLSVSMVMVGCSCSSDTPSGKSSAETSGATSSVDATVPDDEPAQNASSIISDTKNMAAVRMNIKEGVSEADAQAFVDKIKQVSGIEDAQYVSEEEAHARGYDSPFVEYAFSDNQTTSDIMNNVLAIDGASDMVEQEIVDGAFTSAATGEEEKGKYMLVRRSHTTDVGVYIESIDYVLVEEAE